MLRVSPCHECDFIQYAIRAGERNYSVTGRGGQIITMWHSPCGTPDIVESACCNIVQHQLVVSAWRNPPFSSWYREQGASEVGDRRSHASETCGGIRLVESAKFRQKAQWKFAFVLRFFHTYIHAASAQQSEGVQLSQS